MRLIRSFAILTVIVLATAACNGEDAATSRPSEQAASTPAPASPTSTSQPSSQPNKEPAKPDAKEQQRLNEQLIAAAWKNDLRRAQRLIARGADVNATDNTVQSAYGPR
jgi:uncharacterized protein